MKTSCAMKKTPLDGNHMLDENYPLNENFHQCIWMKDYWAIILKFTSAYPLKFSLISFSLDKNEQYWRKLGDCE